MNAYELLKPDGTKSGAWMCGACGQGSNRQDAANSCCLCIYCGELVPGKSRQSMHSACNDAARALDEMRRLNKAEKLENWNGWVFLEGYGHNEGFFRDLQELVEHLDDMVEEGDLKPEDWPEYAWACREVPLAVPDVRDLLRDMCENGYEEMEEDIQGVAELEAALNAFARVNDRVVSQEPGDKVVIIPRPLADSQPLAASLEQPEHDIDPVTEAKNNKATTLT